MSRRRVVTGAALAGALVVGSMAPAGAGGIGGATVLRTAPSGTAVELGGVAAKGGAVVVGWQEEPLLGGRLVYLRWSTDGGASFDPVFPVDDRPRREVRVDTCAGWAWAVSGLHDPGAPADEWVIVIDGRDLDGPSFEGSLVSFEGLGRSPDIACAGNGRLAVAWFRKDGAGYAVEFFARGAILHPAGDDPAEVRLALGSGVQREGLSIAATASRIHVAWFAGDQLKLKRFDVGPGPDFDVTPLATQTLATLPYGMTPRLGADGDRVVLAYMNRADLVARVSTDGGASFGPVRKLVDAPFPSEVGAWPSNADVKGSRLIVSGTIAGGIDELVGEGFVYRSTNDGASWSRVPGSTKAGGTAVAAYVRKGANARIVEAWDQWIDDPAVERVRFARES